MVSFHKRGKSRCQHAIYVEMKWSIPSTVRCVEIVSAPDAVTLMREFAHTAAATVKKRASRTTGSFFSEVVTTHIAKKYFLFSL